MTMTGEKVEDEIYHLTKSFDQMRPVIVNDGWEHTVSDIITLHDNEEEGETLLERYLTHKDEIMTTELYHCRRKSAMANGFSYHGQPVIISEYGGIAFRKRGEGEWGYGNGVAASISGAVTSGRPPCAVLYSGFPAQGV